jgi:hypothetical protein
MTQGNKERMNMKRILIAAAYLLLVTFAPRAMATTPPPVVADSLTLVSLAPAGGTVPGVTGGPLVASNSVEATFKYSLVSAAKGKIGIYTLGVAPNPSHTSLEIPVWVDKGAGEVKTRFSVKCGSSVHISRVRYSLFEQAPGGPLLKTLLEKFQDVKYDFACRPGGGTTGGEKKPDLIITTFGLKSWGVCEPLHPVFTFEVTVKNQGTVASPSSASLGNKALVNAMADDKAGWGGGAPLPKLAPGASQTVDVPVNYLGPDPGFMVSGAPHTFRATVDLANLVDESNNTNNEAPNVIKVGAPEACVKQKAPAPAVPK